MSDFSFNLHVRLPKAEEFGDALVERLLEGSLHDFNASVGRRGEMVLNYTREAEAAAQAIDSALADVRRIIPEAEVISVGPDYVNLTDLAELTDCTRQNMRRYASGEVKLDASFPPPAVSSEPTLWRLVEVGPWIEAHTPLRFEDSNILEVAEAAFHENNKLQLQRLPVVAEAKDPVDAVKAKLASIVGAASKRGQAFLGRRSLDPVRLAAIVTRLAGAGTPVTKFNKLMFYADFRHFKKYGCGLTGLPYARIDLGPVPDDYHVVFSVLQDTGILSITLRMRGPFVAHIIAAGPTAPRKVLTAQELETIQSVVNDFGPLPVRKVVELSHEEPARTETSQGALIDYSFAARLMH